MSNFKIQLVGSKDNEYGFLQIQDGLPKDCRITFKYNNIELIESDTDFFDCFCKIRRQLEKYNLIPFCYGASLNVYPSGMSRDMGLGRMALT